MLPDRLVSMANQIGQFFAAQDSEGSSSAAAEGIADHLRRFWDPRMRAAIVAHLRDGGAGLDPLPRAAVALLAAGPPVYAGSNTTAG